MPAPARPDRTSLVVALGLVLLGVIGVATVFHDALVALVRSGPPAP